MPADATGPRKKSFTPLSEFRYKGKNNAQVQVYVDQNGMPHAVKNTGDTPATNNVREYLNAQLKSQGTLLRKGTGSIYYSQDDNAFKIKGVITGVDGKPAAAGTTADLIKVTQKDGKVTSVENFDVTASTRMNIDDIAPTINKKLRGAQTDNVIFAAKDDVQGRMVAEHFADNPNVRVLSPPTGFDTGVAGGVGARVVGGSSAAEGAAGIDEGASDLLGPLGWILLYIDVQRHGGLYSPGGCAILMPASMCPQAPPGFV